MSAEPFPERLPVGERVLWQGRPCWRTLVRRGFHLRKLALYLGVLLAWYAATMFASEAAGSAALATLRMTGVALTPLVLVCLYAWASSRSTLYTITDRRLVLRIGIAVPISINLPFGRVEAAGLKVWRDGYGNIALTLTPGERVAYLVLWPHARPLRMARAEPMLRCIPDAERVAGILAQVLAAGTDTDASEAQTGSDGLAASSAVRVRAPALA